MIYDKRILQQIIEPNPEKHEYFCYKWTNLGTDKWYMGYHKGKVDDGYWHSSDDEEFKKDFQDPESTWKYEILGWFKTESEAKRYEGNHNHKNNVMHNPQSYNINPGTKPKIDLDRAPKMFERIKNGDFDIKFGPKDDLLTLNWKQVRYVDYPEQVQYISEMIHEKKGNIEDTDPLVIVTGAHRALGFKRGGINGRHTKEGILKSPKATQYKYIEIDLTGWHISEINQLGLLLNPEEKIKKKENDDKDYVKHLVQLWEEEEIGPYDWVAGTLLTSFGLNSKRQGRISLQAKKQIEDIEYTRTTGKTWKKWRPDSAEARGLLEGYQDNRDDVFVCMMSSSMFKLDSIAIALRGFRKRGKTINKVIVVMHHKDETKKKLWKAVIQPEKMDIMDYHIGVHGIDWEFEEAPTHKSDTNEAILEEV